MQRDVAIIGGGAAGIACALRLFQLRAEGIWNGVFTLYDASSDFGGRCAVLRTDKHYFDYGFQRFKNPTRRGFLDTIGQMRRDRLYTGWVSREIEHNHETRETKELPVKDENGKRMSKIFTPSSRLLQRYLWSTTHIVVSSESHLNATVNRIQRYKRDQWIFQNTSSTKWGRADSIIMACPPQSILPAFAGTEEFPLPDSEVIARTAGVGFFPQCVLMLGWDVEGICAFDIMHVKNHPIIAGVYNQNTKEMRPSSGITSLVFTATPSFAARVVEENLDPQKVVEIMGGAASELHMMEGVMHAPSFAASHTWPHGFHNNTERFEQLWDEKNNVGICGDWTQGEQTFEAAWCSGIIVANQFAGFSKEDEEKCDPVTSRNFKRFATYEDETAEVKDNCYGMEAFYGHN